MTIRIEFLTRVRDDVRNVRKNEETTYRSVCELQADVRELRRHVDDIERRLQSAGEVKWPKK